MTADISPEGLQACVDLVYSAEDGQSLINRIESRNGLHTLEQAAKIGLERGIDLSNEQVGTAPVFPGESVSGAVMAFDRAEVETYQDGTLFAALREEWEHTPDFKKAVQDRMNHQQERETAFLNHSGDSFAIYQLK